MKRIRLMFAGFFAAMLLTVGIALVASQLASHNQPEPTDGSTVKVEMIPSLLNQYQPGQVYVVYGSTQVCLADTQRNCSSDYSHPTNFHIFDKDVVRITGLPRLIGHDDTHNGSWQWPAVVVYGSVYTEGMAILIPDDSEPYYSVNLFPTEVGERPIPDFQVGEPVKVSYNFVLRDGPAGRPISVNDYGNARLVYGGTPVTILAGPTLGNDRHYYCQIGGDNTPRSWVPCEFAKVP